MMKKRLGIFAVVLSLVFATALVFAACGEEENSGPSLADLKTSLIAEITTEYEKYDEDDYKPADYALITDLFNDAKDEINALKDKTAVEDYDKQSLYAAMAAVPTAVEQDEQAFLDAVEGIIPSVDSEDDLQGALGKFEDLDDASRAKQSIIDAKTALDGKFAVVFKLIVEDIGTVAADAETDAKIKAADSFYEEYGEILDGQAGVSGDLDKLDDAKAEYAVLVSANEFKDAVNDIPYDADLEEFDLSERADFLEKVNAAYELYFDFKDNQVAESLETEIGVMFDAIGAYFDDLKTDITATALDDFAALKPLYIEATDGLAYFKNAVVIFETEYPDYFAITESLTLSYDGFCAGVTDEFVGLVASAAANFTNDDITAAEDFKAEYSVFFIETEDTEESLSEVRGEFTAMTAFIGFIADEANDFAELTVLDQAKGLYEAYTWDIALLNVDFNAAVSDFKLAAEAYFADIMSGIDTDGDIMDFEEEMQKAESFYGSYSDYLLTDTAEYEKYRKAAAKYAFALTTATLSDAIEWLKDNPVTGKDGEYEQNLATAISEYEGIGDINLLDEDDKAVAEVYFADIEVIATAYFKVLTSVLSEHIKTEYGITDVIAEFNTDVLSAYDYETDTVMSGLYGDVKDIYNLAEDYLTDDGDKDIVAAIENVFAQIIEISDNNVLNVINAISNMEIPSEIDEGAFAGIRAVRNLYEALTDGEKPRVTNLSNLEAAEAAIRGYVEGVISGLVVTIDNALEMLDAIAETEAVLKAYTDIGYSSSDIANAGEIKSANQKVAVARFIVMADEMTPAAEITYNYFAIELSAADRAELRLALSNLAAQFDGLDADEQALLAGKYRPYRAVVSELEAAVALRDAQIEAMAAVDAIINEGDEHKYTADNWLIAKEIMYEAQNRVLGFTNASDQDGFLSGSAQTAGSLAYFTARVNAIPTLAPLNKSQAESVFIKTGDANLKLENTANTFFGAIKDTGQFQSFSITDPDSAYVVDYVLINFYKYEFSDETLTFSDTAVKTGSLRLYWQWKRTTGGLIAQSDGLKDINGVQTAVQDQPAEGAGGNSLGTNAVVGAAGYLYYSAADEALTINPQNGALISGSGTQLSEKPLGAGTGINDFYWGEAQLFNIGFGADWLTGNESDSFFITTTLVAKRESGLSNSPESDPFMKNLANYGRQEHILVKRAREFNEAASAIGTVNYSQNKIDRIIAAEFAYSRLENPPHAAQIGLLTPGAVDAVGQARVDFEELEADKIEAFMTDVNAIEAIIGGYADAGELAASLGNIDETNSSEISGFATAAETFYYDEFISYTTDKADIAAAINFIGEVQAVLIGMGEMPEDAAEFISAVHTLTGMADENDTPDYGLITFSYTEPDSSEALKLVFDKYDVLTIGMRRLPAVVAAKAIFDEAQSIYNGLWDAQKTPLNAPQTPVLNADGSVTGITGTTFNRYRDDIRAGVSERFGVANLSLSDINWQVIYVYRFYDALTGEEIGRLEKFGRDAQTNDILYNAANAAVTVEQAEPILNLYEAKLGKGFVYYATFQVALRHKPAGASFASPQVPELIDYFKPSDEIKTGMRGWGDTSKVLVPNTGIWYFENATNGNIAYNRECSFNDPAIGYTEMYLFLGSDNKDPQNALVKLRIVGVTNGFKFQTGDGADIAGATFIYGGGGGINGNWCGSNAFLDRVLYKLTVFGEGGDEAYTDQAISYGFKFIAREDDVSDSPYFAGRVGGNTGTWQYVPA